MSNSFMSTIEGMTVRNEDIVLPRKGLTLKEYVRTKYPKDYERCMAEGLLSSNLIQLEDDCIGEWEEYCLGCILEKDDSISDSEKIDRIRRIPGRCGNWKYLAEAIIDGVDVSPLINDHDWSKTHVLKDLDFETIQFITKISPSGLSVGFCIKAREAFKTRPNDLMQLIHENIPVEKFLDNGLSYYGIEKACYLIRAGLYDDMWLPYMNKFQDSSLLRIIDIYKATGFILPVGFDNEHNCLYAFHKLVTQLGYVPEELESNITYVSILDYTMEHEELSDLYSEFREWFHELL